MPDSTSYVGTSGIGKVIIREVTAKFEGGMRDEIHVDRSDGMVSVVLTAEEAVAMIAADDRDICRRRHRSVITRITWDNVPAGFRPPSQHAPKKRKR